MNDTRERDIFDDALELTEQAVADQADLFTEQRADLKPGTLCRCGHALVLHRKHTHPEKGDVLLCTYPSCSCPEFAVELDITEQLNDDTRPIAPPTIPQVSAGSTPHQRFAEYFRANPHIFDSIVKLARKDRYEKRRASGQFYFEVLRRRFPVREEYEEYRLPNEYVAPYMRVLILFDPEFDQVVEIRRRADEDRNAFERRDFHPALVECAAWFRTWSEGRCDGRR